MCVQIIFCLVWAISNIFFFAIDTLYVVETITVLRRAGNCCFLQMVTYFGFIDLYVLCALPCSSSYLWRKLFWWYGGLIVGATPVPSENKFSCLSNTDMTHNAFFWILAIGCVWLALLICLFSVVDWVLDRRFICRGRVCICCDGSVFS